MPIEDFRSIEYLHIQTNIIIMTKAENEIGRAKISYTNITMIPQK